MSDIIFYEWGLIKIGQANILVYVPDGKIL